ncbi:hypothetical protein ACFFGV_03280 [Pontibacillus salicampi]|uniref:Uncharacterized protein n=1 Tax=Pontibacillus salicampi TaxID=1449801 RepID=A0ABV6LJP5_9BACI
MRMLIWLALLIVGAVMINRYKYKILNGILTVDVLRKVAVSWSMRVPYVREKILPSILGRSTL